MSDNTPMDQETKDRFKRLADKLTSQPREEWKQKVLKMKGDWEADKAKYAKEREAALAKRAELDAKKDELKQLNAAFAEAMKANAGKLKAHAEYLVNNPPGRGPLPPAPDFTQIDTTELMNRIAALDAEIHAAHEEAFAKFRAALPKKSKPAGS
jgi:hypothetical protein